MSTAQLHLREGLAEAAARAADAFVIGDAGVRRRAGGRGDTWPLEPRGQGGARTFQGFHPIQATMSCMCSMNSIFSASGFVSS